MADIFVIKCGSFPNAMYFDGRQWTVNRDEAFEFETCFDSLHAQDFHRLDGHVLEDVSCSCDGVFI